MNLEGKNVSIIIDYENVHYNFINDYKNIFELSFFQKLKKFVKEEGMNIIDIVAYCNYDLEDMHLSYHQSKLHELGIETRHTSNNGKNYADIQIAVDVMDLIYQNNLIDGIVLVSDDKDMTPLIKSLKRQMGFVYLITSEKSGNLILESPTHHAYFEDVIKVKYIDENKVLNEKIYDNLNSHIQKEFIDKKKSPPLCSLDRFIENCLPWYKIFEYEIIRQLREMEKERKIIVHKYQLKNNEGNYYGKEHIGIITDVHLYLFDDNNPINKVDEYFKENYLISIYNKYNKRP